MAMALIALGSNLGDRQEHLLAALAGLRATPGLQVEAVSSFWETAPVGGPPGQGPYLNAAVRLGATLEPHALMARLLELERQAGRERREPWGPRTLDLDLLAYDDLILDEEGLVLPHPRLHRRRFVLGPLAEVAAAYVHPRLGRSVAALLADLGGLRLLGQRALVTGASSGIGQATAVKLAALGADVVVHAGHRADRAEAVANEVRQLGSEASALVQDLSTVAGCEDLVDAAWPRWGGFDIWVNNAGADILTGSQRQLDFMAKLARLLDVDVRATLTLCRLVGERMRARGTGSLVNVGWDQAETGMEGDSGELFAAAKAAVHGLTKSLAKSLAPAVRVNAVAPGWIRTAWGEGAPSSWQERAVRETPLGRWGLPADVADAIAWLAGPEASFVTGQVIRVNGGAIR
ncbi:MAG TPA: 2-amino-4-hydroxy-6-hydroxymethyldihydropteridine diphosphokinase [Gemmatales bacterium]|nr:2-amino-4-hydroxy-6-hydroxymethyldihydropteridine diphosphokinase [Gemmatales bacterium]HMP60022.1 2-amino-4-hydroxy-6-hydroxymethyldihydropteridine diphosphokinase [Gemmatales bacterium]